MKFEMCWSFTALENKTCKKICPLTNKIPFLSLRQALQLAYFKVLEISLPPPEFFNFKLNT